VDAEISASKIVPSRRSPFVSYDVGAGSPRSRDWLIASTRARSGSGM
jgi:hypothetical protein